VITTLNIIENKIKDLANANLFVETYKFGNFLDAISEKKLKYPILVADFGNGSFTKMFAKITVIITVADRVLNDESNVLEVLSDRLQVARDVYTEMNNMKDILEITASNFDPFFERSGDMITGYVLTININILDVNCPIQLPKI